ncbi:MAG TPA: epoxide hydrolase [Candidatus Binatia bacterium]|nr:epoxide hydrolase [Candidatus Binatia bacterium]
MHTEPFRIHVPDADLADLRERLARTRFPAELPGSGWGYGTDVAYAKELVAYWRDRYDWRAHEARFNELPQIRADVGGLKIHAIHQRGKGPKPFPLVITHGWPGSVYEFTKILGPLTDPGKHGGDPADAFDVVCPSMPGYGWSEGAKEPGMDPERIAGLWVELMHGLGYPRFGAQGGDWGAMVTTYLGFRHAASVAGIHLNMVIAFPPNPQNPTEGAEPDELPALMEMAQFFKDETGYQQIQGTKPQTLSFGLTDSPAGLAAWIVEKFRTWSDCGGDVERRFTKDELLTNVMFYWATATANSSCRLYCETMRAGKFPPTGFRVDVPTGCAIFPKEIVRPPRKWAESMYRVQRWTRFPAGGHFAALEEPEALVEDVRAFFRPLRASL